jgi:hypothetical protein
MIAAAFFLFFVFGWSYYMVATILMRGSIFTAMRLYVQRKAETNKIFAMLHNMLGCLMCTATEAALWTLGIATFSLCVRYRVVDHIVGSVTGQRVALPIGVEVVLAGAVAFALSLAVAGEAWAIKTIVEHQEEKFLELREEFRAREVDLLQRITELETSAIDREGFNFDLT